MEMIWSLEALYPSFEDPAFERDMAFVKESLDELTTWVDHHLGKGEHPSETVEGYLNRLLRIYHKAYRISAFANLSLSVEVKNARALKVVERMESFLSTLKVPQVKFRRWLTGLEDFEGLFGSGGLTDEHRFVLTEWRDNGRYLLSDAEEALAAKMAQTGSAAWAKLQNVVSSTLLVEVPLVEGVKKLPLPVVRNMAYDRDQKTRKAAFEAEIESYRSIEDASAACLNGIKGEAITLAKARGYTSVLEKTLRDSRVEKTTLDSMLGAIRDSLPAFGRYFKKKAQLLGHPTGLPFYDLFAPIGDIDLRYTYEEAAAFIIDRFASFSAHLSNFAKRAFENRWIDALPREGKRGGAFCYNVRVINESRIMANFNGSFNNMTTLAHELGHGYHGECLREQSLLNSHYTMPLAETASIFCETIVTDAAYAQASEAAKLAILEHQISSAAQVIVDIYSRYLFETELIQRREDGSLSVAQLKEAMKNAQMKAYGDGLAPEVLHPYMWINKPHYYSADNNFYNFPYAFGLLFGKGLYAEYLDNREAFVASYPQLLAETGKNSVAEIGSIAGIDVNQTAFWKKSLRMIEEKIDEFIRLA